MTHRCTDPGEHHSSDLVSVYHGLSEPATLCGYHAGKRYRSAGRVWRRTETTSTGPLDNGAPGGMMGASPRREESATR